MTRTQLPKSTPRTTHVDIGSQSLHPAIVGQAILLRAFDMIAVFVFGVLSYYLRFLSAVGRQEIVLIGLGAMLFLGAMKARRAYEGKSLLRQSIDVVLAWLVSISLLLSCIFFFGGSEEYSRLWILYWSIMGCSASLAARLAVAMYFGWRRRTGSLCLNVAVVGSPAFGEYIMKQIMAADTRSLGARGARMVGVFSPGASEPDGPGAEGNIENLLALSRRTRIDEIIVNLPNKFDHPYNFLLGKLSEIPCRLSLCPDLSDITGPSESVGARRGLKLLHRTLMICISERPLPGWMSVLKRAEDLILGSLLLLAFCPLLLFIAVLIKLDGLVNSEARGPVLFCQPRFGFNNNVFTIYKFRTMKAEATKDTAAPQAKRMDPRVTRVGRFLRRTSLDELPQLLNVIKGDMSLVGPRPHPIRLNEHFAEIIDGYLGRHRVKPGITGWAQVNGFRGETSTVEAMEQRIRHDLYYVENWSLLFDFLILLRTLTSGFLHSNAY
jgi:Undecaprenyl-phosphate glucose phosphotransferase